MLYLFTCIFVHKLGLYFVSENELRGRKGPRKEDDLDGTKEVLAYQCSYC